MGRYKSVLLAYSVHLASSVAALAGRFSASVITLSLLVQSLHSLSGRSYRNLRSKIRSGLAPVIVISTLVVAIYVSAFFDNIWWVLIYEGTVLVDLFPE